MIRLWVASLFAEVAEWMLQVALPVYIYQATGSASSTALTMAAGVLPMVLLSPVAGVLADRWDRQRVLWCVCLAQAAVVVPLLAGARDMPMIYLAMAAQSGLASLYEPTRNALLPALAGPGRITAANGMMGVNSSVSRLAGSSLGGLVLGLYGLGWVLAGYVAALVVAAVLLLPRFGVHTQPSSEPMFTAWLDGLAEFRREPRLRVVALTLVLCSLAQGMFLVLFVVFVTGPLRGGETEVGLLRGVQAIGGLAAGGLIATVARRLAPRSLLGGGGLVLGLLSLLIWNMPALTTTGGLYVVLFAVSGAPAVFLNAGLLSVLQTATTPHHTGRVMATAFGAMAAFQVAGMLTAGALAGTWSLTWLLDIQAALIITGGLIGFRQRLRLGRASRPEPTHGVLAATPVHVTDRTG
jgi:MFS family permease